MLLTPPGPSCNLFPHAATRVAPQTTWPLSRPSTSGRERSRWVQGCTASSRWVEGCAERSRAGRASHGRQLVACFGQCCLQLTIDPLCAALSTATKVAPFCPAPQRGTDRGFCAHNFLSPATMNMIDGMRGQLLSGSWARRWGCAAFQTGHRRWMADGSCTQTAVTFFQYAFISHW